VFYISDEFKSRRACHQFALYTGICHPETHGGVHCGESEKTYMVGVWGHRPSESLKHSAIERIREKNINSRKEKQIREVLQRKEPNQLFDSSV
jgi:hypothetical protein